ncbi:WecB/TagA/CpsF family glycosyltransferase [Cyanobium sp. BA5m-10]|uniref:WecB/TagA/CpsF family glycosyltransferase n=1 Tax=Cyanobium sp. BA5m-10 TaxID=2823705 RepID=UPI0020CCBA69|nr:WecB/TagA/CpsF family glycosyltransferase [Cyanobium sp. BA5m-10]
MRDLHRRLQVLEKNLPFPVLSCKEHDLAEVLCDVLLASKRSLHICTINAEIAHCFMTSSRSQKALQYVSYFVPDGIGVELAYKFLFGADAGKLPGIEFSEELLKECALRSWNVALYGATKGRVLDAASYLTNKYPPLSISAVLDGYSDSDDLRVFLRKCQDESVRLVLVALGHPAQDEFISKYFGSLSAIWVGVGGSFDVWSGAKRRSPRLFSWIGLEWLYRILQDPSPQRLKRSLALPAFCLDMIFFRLGLYRHP